MRYNNLKFPTLGKALFCGLVGAIFLTEAVAQTRTNYSTSFATGYTTGNLAGQNGWATISGAGVAPIQVSSTTGLATIAAVAGEDDNVGFTTTVVGAGAAGTVTATFGAVSVTAAGTGGSYSLALGAGLGSSVYTGRVFAKSSGAGFVLGIIPSSNGTVAYGSTVVAFNTPITLAINFGFNPAANDDTLSISVNGASYATYGTAFDFGGTNGGSSTLGSVLFRQENATATALTVGSVNVTSNLVAAPEPGTTAMMGLGAFGAVLMLRRRT